MKYSYNWLKELSKTKLSPEKLAELLTMYFAEVEEVKNPPAGGGKDFILDIDIRPNRAGDCFSHIGVAREIAAITNLKFISPAFTIQEDYNPPTTSSRSLREQAPKNLKARDFVNVEVKNKNACLRYTARVITGVKVGPSPKYIRDKLKVCGLRPINNIVDIANYVMLETGQPLHAFDGGKLEGPERKQASYGAGKKIIVRFAKKGEKIVTLDEEKYDLYEDILVIADAKKPVAIAGIKGGLSAEIDSKTKIVVLESANFNPRVIRRCSKMIDLKTDASLRFEHGIDPNLTEFAINRTAYLIQKIAGGSIAQGLIDKYPKKALPRKIILDLNYVKSLLGLEIPKKEIINILNRLGFKVKVIGPKLEVLIPTFRLDISLPEDLIEEIGRIYGYQKIPTIFPVAALIPPKKNENIFWEDLTKNILKEAGFTEVYNYSFISEKDAEIFGTPPTHRPEKLIEVENPVSEEQKYLRPSLIPNLLKNIQKNQGYFNEIKIFELGKVFEKPTKEERLLTGVMNGDVFYQIKGVVDFLLQKLGISNIWYDEYRTAAEEAKICWWHPKKSAEIKVNGERIGFLGEISSRILDEFKIKSKVIYFDIFFEKLQKISTEEHEYRPISPYPAAIRDIAVLVPREVRVEEVLNKVEVAGGHLVRDIDLFDIYEGEELPEGKKNLAFHIIYQAEDRTLSSEEIDQVHQKIIKTLEEEIEWQVRK